MGNLAPLSRPLAQIERLMSIGAAAAWGGGRAVYVDVDIQQRENTLMIVMATRGSAYLCP